jgi:3-phosphoshikimate 1-carboxyvinyltransferase
VVGGLSAAVTLIHTATVFASYTGMDFLDLPPLNGAHGTVKLPGSKSISNRVLLLSALAQGTTLVKDLLDSDDTQVMLAALTQLGVQWTRQGDTQDYSVEGVAGMFPVKQATLFLGNAGTAFRSLTAALALSDGDYTLSGVARMHERPIGDLVDALRQMGAQIDYLGTPGYPPLHIRPAQPHAVGAISVRGDVSSQFLTGLLLSAPLTGRALTVHVAGELISKPYIEITLNLMRRYGVLVERTDWSSFNLAAGQAYCSPAEIYVEGDASSASYFLAAGAIGGGPVRVEGVGSASIQGDIRFAEALQLMGAQVEMGDNWVSVSSSARLHGIDADFNHIPDAAMTIAVAALFAEGSTTLRNIGSWRVKETDRIHAMATELRKVGATVEEGADYLRVTPPAQLQAATIDTYDDHRMAMCFSLVALGGVGIRINDPQCVNKTFPGYFDVFAQITQAVPVIAIDGPSASGKGTVAGRVAEALGFHYLDSGALYRLTALAAARHSVVLEDEAALAALALNLNVAFATDKICLENEDVSDALRTEAVGNAASIIAALPAVRAALLARQHAFRQAPGLVTDGRDMGSVVFPDAVTKVFLTASAEARAERRYKQLKEKGFSANLENLLDELRERDARDAARSVAPLQQGADASLLDTTHLSIDQAVDAVLGEYRAKQIA